MARWFLASFTAIFRSWCCPLYATLEKLDPAIARCRTGSGRDTVGDILASHRAIEPRAGCLAGVLACVYSLPGRISDARSAWRRPSVMIGNLVQNQFTTARDWPFGSAVSLLLMAIGLARSLAGDPAARRTTVVRRYPDSVRGRSVRVSVSAARGAERFLSLTARGSRCGRGLAGAGTPKCFRTSS